MQIKIIRPFVEEVLLSFDSDGAGQKATMRAILMLRKENITVRIIQLTGGKDPAEIMQKLGPQILTNQVSNAILDSDFLLSRLGAEFPIDTPEGKTKASLVYFSYVDALQSDIQKESCLEQLCQAFNLKPEAVKRDFRNRNQARERLNSRQPLQSNQHKELKIDAELRSILVIIANLDKYKAVRTELLEYEFENLSASQLFNILEECFKNESLSLTSILNHCNEPELTNLITKVISLGEFKENNEDAIQDSIQMLKRKNLERKRDDIMSRIRKFNVNTSHDQRELEKLLEEKMELDRKLMH